MPDSSTGLIELLTKLYTLSTKEEALWSKASENTYCAKFAAGKVEISGSPTPYGLRADIESNKSWMTDVAEFVWGWISFPVKSLFSLSRSKEQGIYKWPDRTFRVITERGLDEFLFDYEHPQYGAVSRLFLVAELAVQTADLSSSISQITIEIDELLKGPDGGCEQENE